MFDTVEQRQRRGLNVHQSPPFVLLLAGFNFNVHILDLANYQLEVGICFGQFSLELANSGHLVGQVSLATSSPLRAS